MPHIAIYATRLVQPTVTATSYRVAGTALIDGIAIVIEWETADISWTAGAATVNTAIQDAAIAATADAGYTVGGADTKRIIGGAVA